MHEVGTHFQVVILHYPREGVSKGRQILALLTIGIPVAIPIESIV